LVGALHVVKVLKELGRKEWAYARQVSTCELRGRRFFGKRLRGDPIQPSVTPPLLR
jgi:hypothetical protein